MAKKTFIGRAFVSITGDTKGLDAALSVVRKKMDALGKDLQKWGAGTMALGAAIQAPLTLAVKKFASLGDTLAKGAKRAGLGAQAFDELGHVASLSGASMAAVEKASINLARVLLDFERGAGMGVYAFRELGLSMSDFSGKDQAARLQLVLERLSGIADPARRAAVAIQVLGRGGKDLLPMLDLGAEGLAHYRQEAQRLGVYSDDMAASAERLSDMFARLGRAVDRLIVVVGAQLAESFDKALTWMTNLVVNVREFVAANPQIVQGLQRLAVALGVIGASLLGVGTALRGLSVFVSPGGVLLGLAGALLLISGALDDIWAKVRDVQFIGRALGDWADRLKSLARLAGSFIQDAFAQVGAMLRPTWDLLKAGAQYGFSWLKSAILDFADWVLKLVARILERVVSSLAEHFASLNIGNDPLGIQRSLVGATKDAASLLYSATGTGRGMIRSGRDRRAAELDLAGTRLNYRAGDWAPATGMAAAGAGEALGGYAGLLRRQLSGLLAPVTDILGGKAGGDSWGEKLIGIFANLDKRFDEFSAPARGPMVAGPQARMAVSALGSFSGRGAQALSAGGGAVQIQKDQLAVLREIRDKIGLGGVGDEEY